jgi:hypothetical protein
LRSSTLDIHRYTERSAKVFLSVLKPTDQADHRPYRATIRRSQVSLVIGHGPILALSLPNTFSLSSLTCQQGDRQYCNVIGGLIDHVFGLTMRFLALYLKLIGVIGWFGEGLSLLIS